MTVIPLTISKLTDILCKLISIDVIKSLLHHGAKISAFDPVAMTEAKKIFPDIDFSNNLEDCLRSSYCVVLLTEWSEFRSLSSKYLSKLILNKLNDL